MSKPKLKLSIVIPVLNEEFYILKLLSVLARQTWNSFEVIVVDGKSKDKTVTLVNKFIEENPNIKVSLIKAPHKGVSYQRNLGAGAAKSDLILFLDADVWFKDTFLELLMDEASKKRWDIATVHGLPEGEGNILDYLTCILYNLYQDMTKRVKPEIYGWMILVKKEMHKKVRGFNEGLFFGEDSDYCKRIVEEKGRFQIFKKPILYYSVRRVVKEGRFNFYKKMVLYFWYSRLYGRNEAQEKIGYEVGQF